MLVDHADAQAQGLARIADDNRRIAQGDLSGVGEIVAHDALDEGAFAGAVAAEEGVHGAGPDGHGDVVEGDERAKALGDAEGGEARGRGFYGRLSNGGGHKISRIIEFP